MINRQFKLKLSKKQETQVDNYLNILSGVYNWGITQLRYAYCESYFDLTMKIKGHAKKVEVHSQALQGTLKQAFNAHIRQYTRRAGKPKFKSARNKLRSFTFPQRVFVLENEGIVSKINLPSFGDLKCFKQQIPSGKIKQAKIIKKASGYYCQLTIDTINTFKVNNNETSVGIDTGFKDIAILSDGTKFENRRLFIKSQKRIAQAQKGKNKKMVSKMHEKIANRRRDYNHKISRKVVESYKNIYVTCDNLRGQAKVFGKSVSDAGISQLRTFIRYKSESNRRNFKFVDSKNTTKTCSSCMSLTGPSGMKGLNVRMWECSVCGTVHDRDINSAKVILTFGQGCCLVNPKSTEGII